MLAAGAFIARHLHRRAGHRAVRAEHTAVARVGLEHGRAAGAVMEVRACVRGHGFRPFMAALWAGQGGPQDYRFANGGHVGSWLACRRR